MQQKCRQDRSSTVSVTAKYLYELMCQEQRTFANFLQRILKDIKGTIKAFEKIDTCTIKRFEILIWEMIGK